VQREYDAVAVAGGLDALKEMQRCTPDLILSDSVMSGMDGYELLRTVKASEQLRVIPFVFLTARADVEMKVAGLEEGADDYIVKPFNAQELMARIKSLLRLRTLMMKNADQANQISSMTSRLQEKYRYGAIIGKSAPMRRIYQLIESLSDSESNVLVTGETGTGKELVANAIHFSSRRSAGPLISVNCGAIPRELMEREFFGHVKGAYTGAVENRRGYFAEASGGTLFLDEIGEMDRDMQVKLLRVLERGEVTRVGDPIPHKVDVRLVAATNKDLRAEIRAGRFREDLFYRIFVIPVHVPPLRERREDIPLLIEHFCDKLKEKMNINLPSIPEQDYQTLIRHDYPGNVRELENLVERFCLLGGVFQDMPADGNGIAAPSEPVVTGSFAGGYDEVFNHPEPLKRIQNMAARDLIMHTLRLCGNNHVEAAKRLGTARSSLYRRINEFESGG
jgi:DNA-binding NtrC family response regulator